MLPTLAEALRDAQDQGLPRLDAQLLMTHVLQQPRTWQITHDDHRLTTAQHSCWQSLVAQRLDDVPLAYLTGQREFYGLPLQVGPAVLDPRPDTETLVDWALQCLDQAAPGARVLDLGTGSGAIALALCHARADADLTAVDQSPDALAIAERNGQMLGLPVQWHVGSWFAPLQGQRFNLIVSNPPYLSEDDPHLPALRHEPRDALCAGADGLDDLRHIVAHAPDHLVPGGWLLLEHGYQQAAAVAALLQARGFTGVDHRRDLAGHQRCTGGQWPR